MKFSLIMCTLGRHKEVELFLCSLIEQTYKYYEIIVVDQNDDDKVTLICDKYKERLTELKYFKVEFKGLSRARNFALVHHTGDIIAFPDDDCIYPKNILEKVKNFFEMNPIGIVTGKSSNKITCYTEKKTEILKEVRPYNMFGILISYTVFFNKNEVCKSNLTFDENLGVGTLFGSTEESDFVLHQLLRGVKCYVLSNLEIYHPNKDANISFERLSYYNLGVGAFIRKNISCHPELIYLLLKVMFFAPLLKSIYGFFCCDRKKIKIAFLIFKSRWEGFFQYGKK
ncbi:glycosyltransferase family A protein [Escherichia albertii]|uniref:Glycosyltransferase n=1 Tax=Escherichia albertii TaxID=208962 RepID=A0A5P8N5Q5_ESCAL|nr:glycosyltransferase family A protein [Escherichia albertii]EJZ2267907.1 glycosyltransferase family 2 protein [Escherichia albertii]MCZ9074969.1 glycosyltransferase family A protein [Escherichia albertii]MCZ9121953.1 glycosyltransferase family A protein [Escherichia albertii]QFR35852.1 glycosyltransferase [Escherichia albertii]WDB98345.1 glycosyltransferase family A protein [Escherichia albertii]